MSEFGDIISTDNWKNEKHVPVIECPDAVPDGEFFNVTVTLGKEIAHPNTTEHHIRWIELYFQPEGGEKVFQLGRFEFDAHGESTDGPNEGPVYTHHTGCTAVKTSKAGTLRALSYCNIHGLWESEKEITLQ
jgi:superoxide reductase